MTANAFFAFIVVNGRMTASVFSAMIVVNWKLVACALVMIVVYILVDVAKNVATTHVYAFVPFAIYLAAIGVVGSVVNIPVYASVTYAEVGGAEFVIVAASVGE